MATAKNNPVSNRTTEADSSINFDALQLKYEQNKKRINTIVTVVLVAAAGIFAYTNLYKAPREKKANTAILSAQHYFEMDSISVALNGNREHKGFLNVIKQYGNTKAGNLSQYYAGICYLKLGDPAKAIKYLEDFDAKGSILERTANGALGDAYMESNNIKKGIDAYKKASSDKDDMALTPIYLFRLGMAYEMNNQTDEAKKAYKQIRDEYPASMQARDIDRYLARLGEIN